ncbi:MAG: hypothetical protein ACR2PR_09325 [Pseudohongiellaceae bacterium]
MAARHRQMPLKTITGARLGFVLSDGGRKEAGFSQKRFHDCVIRAMATATNTKYADVFDEVVRKDACFAADIRGVLDDIWEPMLVKRGFARSHFSYDDTTTFQFADAKFLPRGRYFVCTERQGKDKVLHHAFAVIDGKIYDNGDSRKLPKPKKRGGILREIWVPKTQDEK